MNGVIRQKIIMPGVACHQNHRSRSNRNPQVQMDSNGLVLASEPPMAKAIRTNDASGEFTLVGMMRWIADIVVPFMTPKGGIALLWPL